MKNQKQEPIFEAPKSKKFKKDKPRQERRRRSLSRLENQLASGVKSVTKELQDLDMGQIPGKRLFTKKISEKVPFDDHDKNRINKEIETLKSRIN